jgi:hypothetical protein
MDQNKPTNGQTVQCHAENCRTDTDAKPLKEALTCEVDSALLTFENHNPNTIFLDPSYRVMERQLMEYHYEPVGICKNVPYNRYRAKQIAFVYRYEDELYWCHLPEICWMSFLMEICEKGRVDF